MFITLWYSNVNNAEENRSPSAFTFHPDHQLGVVRSTSLTRIRLVFGVTLHTFNSLNWAGYYNFQALKMLDVY